MDLGRLQFRRYSQDKLANSVPERNFVLTAEPTRSAAGQILRERLSED